MGLNSEAHKTAKTRPNFFGIKNFLLELEGPKFHVLVHVMMAMMTKNDLKPKITGNPRLGHTDVPVEVTMTKMTQNNPKIKKSKKLKFHLVALGPVPKRLILKPIWAQTVKILTL